MSRVWHPNLIWAAACVAVLGTARADEPADSAADLKKLSVEQLMDLEVTSVSRRPEKLSEARVQCRF